MGFDNECILNIQSLAGEYFCPVCRLLVYPNEAIQSQCTHLYCKPCLTYVVSTTRSCPYDGYLVTEADAKPLLESNKALADTIGKIEVHCLYHRSGCTWQGPLSECTSHCSGCAFGNSPVVCNRCGIQIVHREVQEHAQNCPGVQSQAPQAGGVQDATVTGTSAATDQNQTDTQAGAMASQAQTPQATATVPPGQVGNQQANPNPQAPVYAPDQWYQQQQQYQQYYQQFPGYDPYQQQYQMYYPYQQPAAPQYQQQQLQTHPPQPGQQQPPAQSQPLAQAPTSVLPQNQVQANPPQQNHPAVQPPPQIQSQAPPQLHGHPHPHPYPQAQPNQQPQHIQPHQQHPQMPQYQQSHPQMQHPQSQPPRYPAPQPQPHPQAQPPVQLQNHPQSQPQLHQLPAQNLSGHAITGHHSYSQPHLQQQMQPGAPNQHSMHMQSQAGSYHPSPHLAQMQSQFSQQPPQMRPPLSHTPFPNVPTAQQQPIHPHGQQPGHAVHQRPVMQPVQQPMPQQYVQQTQPFVGQPSVSAPNQLNQQGPFAQQQLPMQSQIRPQAPAQPLHPYPQTPQNVAMPHGMHSHQSHFVGGRPTIPSEGVQSQSYAQSAGVHVRPTQQSTNQSSASQVKITTEQLKLTASADQESKTPGQQMAKKDTNELDGSSNPKVDGEEKISLKSETDEAKFASQVDEKTRPETAAKQVQESTRTEGVDVDPNKLENREPVIKQEVKEEGSQNNLERPSNGKSAEVMAMEHTGFENNDLKDGYGLKNSSSLQADEKLPLGTQGPGQDEYREFPPPDQGRHLPSFQQQRPGAPVLHFPSSQHHAAAPGHASNQYRPQGSFPGTEVPPGSTTSFGRGQSQYGPPHRPHIQGHMHPSHPGALRPSQGDPFMGPPPSMSEFDSHSGMMAKLAPHGQQHPANFEQGAPGVHSNMTRNNGAPGLDSSLPPGLRDERFKPPADDRLNPFPADPSRRIMDHGEFEDGKRFPRPSFDAEPLPKSGSYFSSSRPLDMGSIMRSDSTRGHPDFLGPVPGYGGHHMDGLAVRSPPRDYPGIPGSRPGLDEVDGRVLHRFGDPYHEGRFRGLPGGMHRVEFEGPGNSRMGEHLRGGDLIDRSFLPSHLRRGEHFGPRHMLEDPAGYNPFPGHVQRGELGAPGGNFPHHLPPSKSFGGGRPNQRLGEPGFRSSFSLQGYPHDGGMFTGDMDSFDNLRKRKPASMGWCRICKVDCETVEGLDLHAQTREHQRMAMDMVLTIKQNAKKQNRVSRDPSSFEDANMPRNANFGSRGNRH